MIADVHPHHSTVANFTASLFIVDTTKNAWPVAGEAPVSPGPIAKGVFGVFRVFSVAGNIFSGDLGDGHPRAPPGICREVAVLA